MFVLYCNVDAKTIYCAIFKLNFTSNLIFSCIHHEPLKQWLYERNSLQHPCSWGLVSVVADFQSGFHRRYLFLELHWISVAHWWAPSSSPQQWAESWFHHNSLAGWHFGRGAHPKWVQHRLLSWSAQTDVYPQSVHLRKKGKKYSTMTDWIWGEH